jgi:hypothetical protein
MAPKSLAELALAAETDIQLRHVWKGGRNVVTEPARRTTGVRFFDRNRTT